MKLSIICRTKDAEKLAKKFSLSILPTFDPPHGVAIYNREAWSALEGQVGEGEQDENSITQVLEKMGKEGVEFIACIHFQIQESFGGDYRLDSDRRLIVAAGGDVGHVGCTRSWEPFVAMHEGAMIRSWERIEAAKVSALLQKVKDME